MGKDYYKLLGVQKDASSNDEIRKAYHKMARLCHPDKNKNQGMEEKMKEIVEAYGVLSDVKKKADYDKGFSLGVGAEAKQNVSRFGSYMADFDLIYLQMKMRLDKAEESLRDPSITIHQLDLQLYILSSDSHRNGCLKMETLLSKAEKLCSSLPVDYLNAVICRKNYVKSLVKDNECCKIRLAKPIELWKKFESMKEKVDSDLDKFVNKLTHLEASMQEGNEDIFRIKASMEDLLSPIVKEETIFDQLASISKELPSRFAGDSRKRIVDSIERRVLLLEQYKRLYEAVSVAARRQRFQVFSLSNFNNVSIPLAGSCVGL